MLHQDWFKAKRFEMYAEYYQIQCFYDTESKNFYVVMDEYGNKGSTTIQEITPKCFEYEENMKLYKEWKSGWRQMADGDLKYVSPNGNEYWIISFHGWKAHTTYDTLGVFYVGAEDGKVTPYIEKMIGYVFGESVTSDEEIKSEVERIVRNHEN